MKTKLKDEYLKELVGSKYTTAQYRILLLLWQGTPKTTTQMAQIIGVHKQALTGLLRELEADGHIEVDRIEGRNKFYRACPNRLKQTDEEHEGQLSFTEE